ncbi:MAG: tyrosine-type recombinase/integrase [Lachnospiraceae bacterium]|nr:tyrosine-type recombinase/integrase [Lachnospiraceae bacterium]
MSTTQPIRDLKELEILKNYYRTIRPNLRNYVLIHTGLNTALRISDLLTLQWKDVYDFSRNCFRNHISLIEQKTGKASSIAINHSLHQTLSEYLLSLPSVLPDEFLFPGRNANMPLSRSQAFRLIKHACTQTKLPEHISCHSLRKTFGYHAWAAGANPTILMMIYNHSSFSITKRYLGLEQDDKDQIFLSINL